MIHWSPHVPNTNKNMDTSISDVSTHLNQNIEIKSEKVDIIEIDERIFTNDGYFGDDSLELQNVSYSQNMNDVDEQIIVKEEIICKEEPQFYDGANAQFMSESQMILAAKEGDEEQQKEPAGSTLEGSCTALPSSSRDVDPSKCQPIGAQSTVPVVNSPSNEQINTEKPQAYECYVCKYPSRTIYSLQLHFVQHIGAVEYKCQHCAATFKRKWYYSRHIHQEHSKNGEKFTCTYCYRAFITRKRLENHERIHTGQKPWCCSVCHKRFNTRSSFTWHMKSHTAEKQFKCTECSLQFRLKHHLDLHMTKHVNGHKETETITERECLQTDLTFANGFLADVRTHQCYLCGFILSNRNKLKMHMRVQHTGEKLFNCELCKKVFLRYHSIELHMLTHTKSCDFKCDICGDVFKRKDGLKMHIQAKHSQQTVFQCEVCLEKFYKKFTFVTHMRRHTGVKPFKCEFCPKSFVKKSDMVRHTRTHTGERPHQCNVCKMTFTRNNLLTEHKRNVHGL